MNSRRSRSRAARSSSLNSKDSTAAALAERLQRRQPFLDHPQLLGQTHGDGHQFVHSPDLEETMRLAPGNIPQPGLRRISGQDRRPYFQAPKQYQRIDGANRPVFSSTTRPFPAT